MPNKNKTRPDVTAPERVTETKTTNQAIPISDNNLTTVKRKRQAGFIEQLLPQGEENALPTNDLVRLSGFKDSRSLQSAIAVERDNGALILSTSKNGGGYFLPDDGSKGTREIKDFIHTLNNRAISTQRTLRSARRAVKMERSSDEQ